jgi:transcriptional regulator with XRE-family HTH domain
MSSEPAWATMPAVLRAAQTGDHATLLRIARTAAGLTLAEAGRLAGYSSSTMSRLETGRRRSYAVGELRRLAKIYGIPLEFVGLLPSPETEDGTTVGRNFEDGGDRMHRRELLISTVGTATGLVLLPSNESAAADGLTTGLEEVLFGRSTAPAIPAQQLAAQIAAARADLRACRYTQLAQRLPRLLAQAGAGHDQAPEGQRARAAGRLAQAYGVTTQLLLKLHDNAMAWSTADRAVQAARASGDPLIEAETTRLAATTLRRTRHRDGAQGLVLRAAQQLDATTGLLDPAHTAMYGKLLAVAAYTAALRDDRSAALTLLTEAEDAARRAGRTTGEGLTTLDVAGYKISVARVLGDYGTAVEYARLLDPARISTPERRARYWEDTALALHGRGRMTAAYEALLTAERDTPQEVRYRPWAQQLTRDLMTGDTRGALPGLREFAERVGVVGRPRRPDRAAMGRPAIGG